MATGAATHNITDRGDSDDNTYSVYDRDGNLTDVYEPQPGNNHPSPHWQYTYDLSGDETSVADPRSSYDGSNVAQSGYTTQYFYDENGNKVRQVMPDGNAETWTYNQYGQILTSTDFDLNSTIYSYFTTGTHAGMLQWIYYLGVPLAQYGDFLPSELVTYTYTALGQKSTVTTRSAA